MKASLKPMKTVAIKTKTFDGGASKANRRTLRPSEKHVDPWSFYSSHDNLIDALLGRGEEVENRPPAVRADAAAPAQDQDGAPRKAQDGAPRKTRLSFEVHPSLIMLQMLEEI